MGAAAATVTLRYDIRTTHHEQIVTHVAGASSTVNRDEFSAFAFASQFEGTLNLTCNITAVDPRSKSGEERGML